jgi:uncharacterized delta-60 repeat protein
MKNLNLLFILFAFAINANAQNTISFDSTWATNGRYQSFYPGSDNGIFEGVLQLDGKLVTVGVNGSPTIGFVTRFNTNGSLDNTFGNGGISTINNTSGNEFILKSIALQNNNNIIVGGIEDDGMGEYFKIKIYSLNSSGVVSTTFGNNAGLVNYAVPNHSINLNGIKVQSDNKILVGYTITDTANYTSLGRMLRLTPSGIIDSSYGVNGISSLNILPSIISSTQNAFVLTSADKVVSVYNYEEQINSGYGLSRLKSNGTIDSTFGVNGNKLIPFGTTFNVGQQLVLDSFENIFVGGFGVDGSFSNFDVYIEAFTANGNSLNTFGINGVVTKDINGMMDLNVSKMAVDSNNNLYCTVVSMDTTGFNGPVQHLLKFSNTGINNPSFGTNGAFLLTDYAGVTDDLVKGLLVIQSDNKIITGGFGIDNFAYGIVDRYKPSFASPIVYTLQVNAPNGGELWQVNTSHPITWTTNVAGGSVSISYSTNNGTSWNNITTTAPNNGSHNWTIPATLSTNCLVSVKSNSQITAADTSNALFSIIPATVYTLQVTSPNGAELWFTGSNQNINWNTNVTGGNVKINYTIDNGLNWLPITNSTTNNGTYNWTLPNTASALCKVTVSSLSQLAATDTSNNTFRIEYPSSIHSSTKKSFTLSPNPADKVVTINIEGAYNLIVIDGLGRVVKTQSMTDNKLDVSDLKTGIYTLIIKNKDLYNTGKLMIKH